MACDIRRATPEEAEALTLLAHAAKSHWGYPSEWIDHWKPELTITSEFIANNEVFVAVVENRIAGCCALVTGNGLAELEHMWIEPNQMGRGIGRALFEHTKCRALAGGYTRLELAADPNAEGFYERMGAKRIGEIPADLFGHARVLPRMRIDFGVPLSAASSDRPA
jgi:N-acetylglutamate synthase-like GNAT family acetyltransferase